LASGSGSGVKNVKSLQTDDVEQAIRKAHFELKKKKPTMYTSGDKKSPLELSAQAS
jgi:hypothetical protein